MAFPFYMYEVKEEDYQEEDYWFRPWDAEKYAPKEEDEHFWPSGPKLYESQQARILTGRQLKEQFKARMLARQAAENKEYVKQFLAGKTSKSNQCESHRERESDKQRGNCVRQTNR